MKLTAEANSYPFSISKSEKYFPEFIDGKRRVILRSTHSALPLLNPDTPIHYQADVNPQLDSVNLHAVRFYDIGTLNDSCIISQSAAKKLEAYKVTVQDIEVPLESKVTWKIEESTSPEEDLRMMYYSQGQFHDKLLQKYDLVHYFPEVISAISKFKESAIHFVRPRQLICSFEITKAGRDGVEIKTVRHKRTKVKLPWGAVVVSITESPTNRDHTKRYTIVYKSIAPLMVGDKLMNQTGHKFTIGKILPDEEMPTANGVSADILIPFEVGKRCTPASFLEEMASLVWHETKDEKLLLELCSGNSVSSIRSKLESWMETNNISHTCKVQWNNLEFDAPHGVIRIYRCDKIPSETLKWTTKSHDDKKFNPSLEGVKLTYTLLLLMYIRGAEHLLKWATSLPIKDERLQKIYNTVIKSLTGSFENEQLVEIWKYMPGGSDYRTFFDTGISEDMKDEYVGTVLDPDIASGKKYGYVKTYDGKGNQMDIIMPPVFADVYANDWGLYVLNQLARHLNNIVLFTTQYEKNKDTSLLWKIDRERKKYLVCLTSVIADCVSKHNSPYTGSYVYGVASADADLEIHQVGIPERAFRAFSRKYPWFREKPMVLLGRHPVHDECELFAVSVVPKYTDTVSIHPVLISLLRGDFDGDALLCIVPSDPAAYSDLQKMHLNEVISNDELWNIKWIVDQVCQEEGEGASRMKWEKEFDTLTHPDMIGISSTFKNMEFENKSNWDHFCGTLWTTKLIDQNSLQAGWAMGNIKKETALVGSLALSFIGWLIFHQNEKNEKCVSRGLQFYRFVAENSLSNKHGGGSHARKLCDFARAARTDDNGTHLPSREMVDAELTACIKAGGANPEEFKDLYELFWTYLEDKSEFPNQRDFLDHISPVFTMIRHQSSQDTVRKFLKGNIEQKVEPSMFSMLERVGP